MEATNPYPLLDGPLLLGSNEEKKKYTDLAKSDYINKEIRRYAECVTFVALIIIGCGIYLVGGCGLASALTTTEMGVASIKVLTGLTFMLLAGYVIMESSPPPVDCRKKETWEKVQSFLESQPRRSRQYSRVFEPEFSMEDIHKVGLISGISKQAYDQFESALKDADKKRHKMTCISDYLEVDNTARKTAQANLAEYQKNLKTRLNS